MDPVAAWYVSNILLGTAPPENGAANRIAFKTGTSYGYRDAWAIGFDGRHTVGVWVGRPDGAPVPGLVGRSAAAPIVFDAFARIGAAATPAPRAPAGALVASNAKLPPPLRRFQPGSLAGNAARPPLRIVFPPDGARLDLSSTDGKPDPVALKVTGAIAPLTVLVNGVPVRDEGRGALFFNPDGPGFSRVTVMDALGATDSVVVRVDDSASAAVAAAVAR
jgi:penicillin-binding protein 1C